VKCICGNSRVHPAAEILATPMFDIYCKPLLLYAVNVSLNTEYCSIRKYTLLCKWQDSCNQMLENLFGYVCQEKMPVLAWQREACFSCCCNAYVWYML